MKQFQISILGDAEVGKTSICLALTREIDSIDISEFFDFGIGVKKKKTSYSPTIGADHVQKQIRVDNEDVMLKIWDIAGQERFFESIDPYISGSLGAIIIFDLTKPETLLNVTKWIKKLANASGRGLVPFILVGNKIDLHQEHPTIKQDNIMQYIQKLHKITEKHGFEVPYFTTSSLTGENIEKIFIEMVKTILKAFHNKKEQKMAEDYAKPTSGAQESNIRIPKDEIIQATLFGETLQELFASKETKTLGLKQSINDKFEFLSSVKTIPPIERTKEEVLVKREWNSDKNEFNYLVKVTNYTPHPLNSLILQIEEYPRDIMKVMRKELNAPIIPPNGGSGSFSFKFEKLSRYMKGKIKLVAAYTDINGNYIPLKTILDDITSIMEFLRPSSKTNEELALIIQTMKGKTSSGASFNKKAGLIILEHIGSLLGKKNFRIYRKLGRKIENKFIGRLLAGAQEIDSEGVIVLFIDVLEQAGKGSIRIEILSEKEEISDTILLEFRELLKKERII